MTMTMTMTMTMLGLRQHPGTASRSINSRIDTSTSCHSWTKVLPRNSPQTLSRYRYWGRIMNMEKIGNQNWVVLGQYTPNWNSNISCSQLQLAHLHWDLPPPPSGRRLPTQALSVHTFLLVDADSKMRSHPCLVPLRHRVRYLSGRGRVRAASTWRGRPTGSATRCERIRWTDRMRRHTRPLPMVEIPMDSSSAWTGPPRTIPTECRLYIP
mmetsp:Transcript_16655/g.47791  ORF Transcript_16655/g.47791 Transcript_16655/m.47791 type:complete len:211 (-) Transcript_16655:1324-1956(-)